MPLRQEILKQRWSTFDLPILLFLAPRGFSPWPSRRNKAHQSTYALAPARGDHRPLFSFPSTVAGKEVVPITVGEGGGGGDCDQQCTTAITNSSVHQPAPQTVDLIVHENIQQELTREQVPDIEQKAFAGGLFPRRLLSKQSGLKSLKTKAGDALSDQSEEFRKKYKEIWGDYESAQIDGNMGMLGDISTIEQLDEGTIEWSPILAVPKSTASTSIRRCAANNNVAIDMAARRRFEIGKINHLKLRSIKGVRPKSVSWKPPKHENFGFSWHASFAALNFRNESFMRGRKHPRLLVSTTNHLPASFRRMLIQHRDSASLRSTWEMLPEADRIKFWPELMHTALKGHPDSALKVLIATQANPNPPNYAVVDCLEFIVSHYFGNQNNVRDDDINRIFEAILLIIRNRPEDHIALSQHSIYLLISNLGLERAQKLYMSLKETGSELHDNTLMHFASFFAKSGKVDLAFEILTRLREQGADFSSMSMSSLCVTLLDRRHRLNNKNYTDFGVFEFMLECGLKPNIIIYNVLIQNSLHRGDHETGWQIHDMLIENGNVADEYTYSILLNDAKIRLDVASIRRVMGLVVEGKIRNEYIMTDILHATYLLHQQEHGFRRPDPGETLYTAFETMLPTFCENFDTTLLTRLIPTMNEARFIPEESSNIPEQANQNTTTNFGAVFTKMWPQYPTLVVMVTAYLRGISRPDQAVDFYQHFRQLVRDGDEKVRMFLSTSHIYDAILMALGRFRETLPMCSQVVEDMLKHASNSQKAAAHKSKDPHPTNSNKNLTTGKNGESDVVTYSPITIAEPESFQNLEAIPYAASRVDWSLPSRHGPAPTVRTWSILLNIFMLHRQPRAAEKVLDLMTARGISPNLVTWNTLCSGYARLQDAAMAVDVIERLERAGLETDDHTMRGLSTLKDRRALIRIMREKEARMQMTEAESRNAEATLDSLQNALDAEKELNRRVESEDGISESIELKVPIGDIKANPNPVDENAREDEDVLSKLEELEMAYPDQSEEQPMEINGPVENDDELAELEMAFPNRVSEQATELTGLVQNDEVLSEPEELVMMYPIQVEDEIPESKEPL